MSPMKHKDMVSFLYSGSTLSLSSIHLSAYEISCAEEMLQPKPKNERAKAAIMRMIWLLFLRNMFLFVQITNISRIILKPTINWLNLREYAIVYRYEKVCYNASFRCRCHYLGRL